MAEITASEVKELRERTGAGMMDCKEALVQSAGDMDRAVDVLRKKGLADLAKRAGRATREGLVQTWVSEDGAFAAIVEVNCETDFVARNEQFAAFVDEIARQVATQGAADLEGLLSQAFVAERSLSVEQALGDLVGKLGENTVISRFERYEVAAGGVVGAYVHGIGRIGVLVELEGAASGEGAAKAKDVAMHVAASDPGWVSREDVPADVVAHERAIYAEQAAQSGKPGNVIDRIVEGKLEKFYQEVCLMEQPFIRDDKVTVADYLGKGVKVTRFVRYKLGEGGQA